MSVLKKESSPFIVLKKDDISCIMSSKPIHPGHCIILPNNPIESWYFYLIIFYFIIFHKLIVSIFFLGIKFLLIL